MPEWQAEASENAVMAEETQFRKSGFGVCRSRNSFGDNRFRCPSKNHIIIETSAFKLHGEGRFIRRAVRIQLSRPGGQSSGGLRDSGGRRREGKAK
jgi:hypothetical protein